MSLDVGAIGAIIAIDADFDLSGNNGLQLTFTKPDLTQLIVTKADGVTAPDVEITDDIQTYQANTYWQYITKDGDIDQAGTWSVQGKYTDASPKTLCGDTVTFLVEPCG